MSPHPPYPHGHGHDLGHGQAHGLGLARLGSAISGPWGVAILVLGVTVARLIMLTGEAAAPFMPAEADLWLAGEAPLGAWPEIGPLLPWLLDLLGRQCDLATPCFRLVAPLGHGLASWFLYRLGARLFDVRVGFWCALLYLTAPAVIHGGMVVGPMALLMPAWCLGLHALARARAVGRVTDWAAIGLAFGIGLMVHPVMLLFAPLALVYLLAGAGAGAPRLWRGPGPLVAVVTVAVALMPHAVWNALHDWQGVRDLGAALARAAFSAPTEADPAARLLLLGVLAGGPLVSLALAWVLIRLPVEIWRGALADDRVRMLVLFSLPVLVATAVLALAWEGGISLTLPALPAALVMVVAWLRVRDRAVVLWLALFANLALAPLLARGGEIVTRAGWVVPAPLAVFAPGEGWEVAGRWLDALARAHPDTPLAVAGENAPLLAYHAARHGVALTVLGRRQAPAPDFDGLMVLPWALAEASGRPLRARLTVTLPQGETRRWAAIRTEGKP